MGKTFGKIINWRWIMWTRKEEKVNERERERVRERVRE